MEAKKDSPIYICKSCGEDQRFSDGENMVGEPLPSHHGLCMWCWSEENDPEFMRPLTPEEIESERLCSEYIVKHKLQPNLDFPD